MSFDLDFSGLEVIEHPVTGPDGNSYILREASGDTVAKFNNARAACIRLADGKVAGVRGQGDIEPLLVSMCLFSVSDSGVTSPKHLAESIVRAWPSKVVSKLFDVAKQISEIDQDDDLTSLKKQRDVLDEQIVQIEEDQAKNEPSSTDDGSS